MKVKKHKCDYVRLEYALLRRYFTKTFQTYRGRTMKGVLKLNVNLMAVKICSTILNNKTIVAHYHLSEYK